MFLVSLLPADTRLAFSYTYMRNFCNTILALILTGTALQSRAQDSGSGNQAPPGSQSEGNRIFATNCAACHGLDGSGTQRAPNIVNSERVQRLSSADILRIVSAGVPGTGMPGFSSLGEARIKAVVGYVRDLQGKNSPVSLPGDPQHGRQLFFGSAACSSCHAVAGAGGFIAPDLTTYAQAHSAERMKAAIVDRAARDSILDAVTLTDEDGKQYRGIIRNEDNFSLQLQSFDGSFHFFVKSALKHIDRDPSSLMPEYRSKLTSGELDDVVSYLHSIGAGTKQSQKKEQDEQ
ncbi:MAG TPA: c-type cytochrome [Terriglobales bacterium]|nr:c-type cytochrome [Terriglobales bacterium]